jgi:hypothetical protein
VGCNKRSASHHTIVKEMVICTTLFVSSTCYDLAQLRTNLRDFSEAVGFEPVLSELDSFPVNPSQSAIQNCLEVVRTRADLFVLVVGGRYGSMNDAGKSITNLEYLEASARGFNTSSLASKSECRL